MTKFYQTLNQPPRSMKNHGKHRRAGTPAHSHPVDGAGDGAGGPDAGLTDFPLMAYLPAIPGWFTLPSNLTAFPDLPFGTITRYEPKPPTIPYAGIRTGEIIGHRLWWAFRVRGEARISSLTRVWVWAPGKTMEGDINELVACGWPEEIYGGVYAYATQLAAHMEAVMIAAEFGTRWMPYPAGLHDMDDLCIVRGTLKMWGDVVEHETGYRAQYAKVASFDAVFHGTDGILEELRERHKV